MGTFYKSIALYYDDIFPYSSVQKDFVLAMAGNQCEEKSLLDIGCGTGNLTIELSKHFKNIIGIDYDRDMVRMATLKMKEPGRNIQFITLNMLDIATHFAISSFDFIICFGNTLVHLGDSGEIESFLRQTGKLLKPGGKLLLQIVHYDRIIKKAIRNLPLIENERVRFERFYQHHPEAGKMEFTTVLIPKDSKRIIRNKIDLYPILKDEIERILEAAGYSRTIFYGSFKREPLSENSIPLIVKASNIRI
jgi:SAM-dependent methyltransferase